MSWVEKLPSGRYRARYRGEDGTQQRSIQVMVAIRSSSRLVDRRRFRTFFCSSERNDSIAPLSAAEPTLPIDPTMPWRSKARWNSLDRN